MLSLKMEASGLYARCLSSDNKGEGGDLESREENNASFLFFATAAASDACSSIRGGT